MTEYAKIEEVKITREKRKYDELCMYVKDQKPTKIIWGYPDTVEMTDKDGDIHTYSIIELLDGLKALAQQIKKEQQCS